MVKNLSPIFLLAKVISYNKKTHLTLYFFSTYKNISKLYYKSNYNALIILAIKKYIILTKNLY